VDGPLLLPVLTSASPGLHPVKAPAAIAMNSIVFFIFSFFFPIPSPPGFRIKRGCSSQLPLRPPVKNVPIRSFTSARPMLHPLGRSIAREVARLSVPSDRTPDFLAHFALIFHECDPYHHAAYSVKPRMNLKTSGKHHTKSNGRTSESPSGRAVTLSSEGSGAFLQTSTKQQPVLSAGTVPCKICRYLMDAQRVHEHMVRFHGKAPR
jgi:hypothetical protein